MGSNEMQPLLLSVHIWAALVQALVRVQPCWGSCSLPGHSRRSTVTGLGKEGDHLLDDIPEGSLVDYTCNEFDVLIGATHRRCVGGKWTDQPPKCASKLNESIAVKTNGGQVIITFGPTKVDALQVNLMGPHNLTLDDITLFNTSHCEANIAGQINETTNNWTLTCLSTSFNITADAIQVTFNDKLHENPEEVFVYSVQEDYCETFDDSVSGITVKNNYNNTDETKFVLVCYRGFAVGSRTQQLIECTPYGPWPAVPLCIPKHTCRKLPEADVFSIDYNERWNDSHTLAGSMAVYKCRDSGALLRGNSIRACNASGVWTESAPKCVVESVVREETESFSLLITLSISLVSTIVVIAVLMLLVQHKNRKMRRLVRIGSLQSRQFNDMSAPTRFKMSYKTGTMVDDEVCVTSRVGDTHGFTETHLLAVPSMEGSPVSTATDLA